MESDIGERYESASRRLFLLDYDGTLTNYQPDPADAKPGTGPRSMLQLLSGNPKNTVVIISGRDRTTLNSWFGDLPLALVAEHGAFRKIAGNTWQTTKRFGATWKQDIRPIMHAATHDLPGAFVEEKTSALVWHYRQADANKAALAAGQLSQRLVPLLQAHRLSLVPGNKIIEVKIAGVDKGIAATYWLEQTKWDFILAAGDDRTDEDLFRALPKNAFTIKIGPGDSSAHNRLPHPDMLVQLLRRL